MDVGKKQMRKNNWHFYLFISEVKLLKMFFVSFWLFNVPFYAPIFFRIWRKLFFTFHFIHVLDATAVVLYPSIDPPSLLNTCVWVCVCARACKASNPTLLPFLHCVLLVAPAPPIFFPIVYLTLVVTTTTYHPPPQRGIWGGGVSIKHEHIIKNQNSYFSHRFINS